MTTTTNNDISRYINAGAAPARMYLLTWAVSLSGDHHYKINVLCVS